MDKDFILILTIVESAQIILKYFVTSLQQNVNDKNYLFYFTVKVTKLSLVLLAKDITTMYCRVIL